MSQLISGLLIMIDGDGLSSDHRLPQAYSTTMVQTRRLCGYD
ncbi:MAG: hypothetical protein ACWGOX_06055 [Desulforhopalus sp.]